MPFRSLRLQTRSETKKGSRERPPGTLRMRIFKWRIMANNGNQLEWAEVAFLGAAESAALNNDFQREARLMGNKLVCRNTFHRVEGPAEGCGSSQRRSPGRGHI